MEKYHLLIIFLAASLLSHHTHAYKYKIVNNVRNTPGGQLFDRIIGYYHTMITLDRVNQFIWKVFNQDRPSLRNNVPVVTLYISDFNGYAYKNGPDINVSGPALDKFYYPRSKSRFFFETLMYHEMTHVFQWHGNFTAPGGLTEGMADYVVVKSGVYEKEKFPKAGEGKRWDQGYGVTARFLEYCDGLKPGFTPRLNMMMRYKYSDSYFVELLGKPVDQVWREYKAKYGNLQVYSNAARFAGLEY